MTGDGVKGPLDGIVVIDLTLMLAGPYCTMVLGDLGARVIKVEPPAGDTTRRSARLPGDEDPRGFGGYYQSINRNKESVVIDLKTEAGKAVLHRLIAGADLVTENFRSGVMERLGLAYEQLRAVNPKLVYATLRGFGDKRTGASPYDAWPAFDVVAQAMGGIMGITGPRGGAPLKIGAGVGDIVPALFLAIGALSGVIRARATGQAQFVDVGMYDSILAVCERIIFQHSYLGENPGPEGTGHPLLCPFGLFPAADGDVAIACPHDHFWDILAHEIGRPDAADDPRYELNNDRVAHREEVESMVAAWTGRHSKAEIMARLGGRIPLGPVNRAEDIVNDPHVVARNLLATLEQPGPAGRPVQVVNTPLHFLETPAGVRRRGAMLGEDTDRVLGEFGYSTAEIADLRTMGAVA